MLEDSYHRRLRAVGDARQYLVQDADPSHLSPKELAEEIALARLVLVAHYRLCSDMRNLNSVNPDFAPAPTTLELNDIMHEPHSEAYLHPFGPGPAAFNPQPEP